MATVSRKSYLRRCDLIDEVDGTTSYQYWGEFVPPEIVPQDGDAVHHVTSSDRIDSLAKKYYGDSRLWWVIAQVNDMDDPVSGLYIGRKLRIPSPRYILETIAR